MVRARSPERLGVWVGKRERDDMCRCNACEKKTSLSLATRLFLSNAPITVRYVSDGASYCTYTTVEKEVRWHMLHHGREHVPTLRHPGIVPHFETRTVNKF